MPGLYSLFLSHTCTYRQTHTYTHRETHTHTHTHTHLGAAESTPPYPFCFIQFNRDLCLDSTQCSTTGTAHPELCRSSLFEIQSHRSMSDEQREPDRGSVTDSCDKATATTFTIRQWRPRARSPSEGRAGSGKSLRLLLKPPSNPPTLTYGHAKGNDYALVN